MGILKQLYTCEEIKDFINKVSDVPGLSGDLKETIRIPDQIGKGFIKNISFEEGFAMQYFNFSLNDELNHHFFSVEDQQEIIYKLVINMEDWSKADNLSNDKIYQVKPNHKAILFEADMIREFYIEKNAPVYRLMFIFSLKWLNRNFAEAQIKINQLIENYELLNQPAYISEAVDSKGFIMANEMAKELNTFNFPLIHIKTRGLIILTDFLNKIISSQCRMVKDETIHYKTMVMVEKRILQCLEGTMPCMNKLAAEFNVSESTLKRHFKKVYGKNAVEYYREKRLIAGKNLLENEHKTIGEVSQKLGYSKPNSFSKAFRKYFGYLPREIRYSNTMIV